MYMYYLIIDKKCVQLKIQQKQASCADQEKVTGVGGESVGYLRYLWGSGAYIKKKYDVNLRNLNFHGGYPNPLDLRMSTMSLYLQ